MYNQKANEYSQRYEKAHIKRITIKYTNAEYKNVILPAVERSGLPMATYIKQAVIEKIERESGQDQQ